MLGIKVVVGVVVPHSRAINRRCAVVFAELQVFILIEKIDEACKVAMATAPHMTIEIKAAAIARGNV